MSLSHFNLNITLPLGLLIRPQSSQSRVLGFPIELIIIRQYQPHTGTLS